MKQNASIVILAVALLAAAPPGDEETFKAALDLAIQKPDRYDADKAGAGLAKCNTEAVAPALAAAYNKGLLLHADFLKAIKKWAKEMEIHAAVRDKTGKVTKEGNPAKWTQAKKEFDSFTSRAAALHALLPRVPGHMAKLTSPEAVQGVLAVLKAEGDWVLRAYAAEALVNADDPSVLKALLDAGRIEKSDAVKVAISDALAPKAKASEDARKLLMGWLAGSTMWQVRAASAQALAASGDKSAVLPLITAMPRERGRLRWEFNDFLKNLTLVDKNGDAAAWKSWWDKSGADFLSGNTKPDPLDGEGKRAVPAFYGHRMSSDRVAFLLECSGSMKTPSAWKPDDFPGDQKPEGERRIDVARHELIKTLNALPENAGYALILFGGNVVPFREVQSAGGAARRPDAIKFLRETIVLQGSNLFGGFQKAFDWTGGDWDAPLKETSFDTIYLISSGSCTIGLLDSKQFVERVLDTLRFRKVLVHTVATCDTVDGGTVMKNIAGGTRGSLIVR